MKPQPPQKARSMSPRGNVRACSRSGISMTLWDGTPACRWKLRMPSVPQLGQAAIR